MHKNLLFFDRRPRVKYSFLCYQSSFRWSNMVKSFFLLLFLLVAIINPVALIETMFLLNRHIYFLFLFLFFFKLCNILFNYFFMNYFAQNYFSFLNITFLTFLYPPDNTYVQHICITKHLQTSLCHYILFSFITVLSGFQSTSFINIQRSLATRHTTKHKRFVFQSRLDGSKFQKHSILLFLNIVHRRPV